MEKIINNWEEIQLLVKEGFDISDVSFKSFILPLYPHAIDGNTLYIIHKTENNHVALKFLHNKYANPLKITIFNVTGSEYDIEFVLPTDQNDISDNIPSPSKEINNSNYKMSQLNPKYTFDKFVVGDNNKFAYTAAVVVAESPGETYNPLYIYGGPGLGKTHLMHSIGNYITERNPEKKILYVTTENFLNDVIESLRSASNNVDAMAKVRDKYRTVDILMIDDIQFIIGKERTQTEFFHTFNTLYSLQKQIVISSDRSPREMETLEERIKSRFEMGLMADIGIPDYETRIAILKKKLESFNVTLNDDILNYIAENIRSNVREIEGALNKLIAFSTLEKQEITLDIAKKELHHIIHPDKHKEITPQLIIEVVSEHYNISVEQMCSLKKNREISKPRQIAMFLCREMTDYAFNSIGSLLGGKDHSTVIHGVKKISEEYNDDKAFHDEIETIKKKINQNK